MKQALVTGATGFVGANLARLLADSGRKVRVLVRPSADLGNLEGLDAEICAGDLRQPSSLVAAVRGCDEVYHVAADYRFWAPNPREVHESNVEGTRALLGECLKQNVSKVVYTSTVGAIGLANQPEPCDESTPMAPGQVTSVYKKTKIEAEKVAFDMAKAGLPVVIVNPSTPIGPWDRKPTPTGKIILDFVAGKMPAYVETGLNFVHVRDVAMGHLLAAEKGRPGDRYILGNRNIPLGVFLRMVGDVVGKAAPKYKIPYWVAWASGWTSTRWSDWVTHRPPGIPLEAVEMSRRFMYFDSTKAVRELGLPQTPIEDAVEDAVKWFSENGFFNQSRVHSKHPSSDLSL